MKIRAATAKLFHADGRTDRQTFPILRMRLRNIFLFLWRCGPTRAMASSFLRLLDHNNDDASQSVGLLWTSDQFVAETST